MLQQTPEWHQARCGRFTSSRMGELCARSGGGWGATHGRYVAEVVQERLTRIPYPSPMTWAMQWGVDHEDEACELYAFTRAQSLERVGFVPHPTMPNAGASPDRLVGRDGLLEVKCPETHTHIQYLINRRVPRPYLLQIQWQLECTGRAWCDWVSYDPRFEGGDIPPGSELVVVRVKRDEDTISELRSVVRQSEAQVQRMIESIKAAA